MVSVSNKVY